eukprot:CAMPEP_0194534222 /NCGR_PEP_ID=MMETSP0253-20130528/72339_1 /TAXON_ID=2966 /ORGANISM="Noctiluca scintillans" /LENGTH=89 /DNA_ID=CAMNT_0039379863 /DNA_START=53 /DNA_END=323 /DNA_ORIENTATION=+
MIKSLGNAATTSFLEERFFQRAMKLGTHHVLAKCQVRLRMRTDATREPGGARASRQRFGDDTQWATSPLVFPELERRNASDGPASNLPA